MFKKIMTILGLMSINACVFADTIFEVKYNDNKPVYIVLDHNPLYQDADPVAIYASPKYEKGLEGIEAYITELKEGTYTYTMSVIVPTYEMFKSGKTEVKVPMSYSQMLKQGKFNLKLNDSYTLYSLNETPVLVLKRVESIPEEHKKEKQ